MTLTNRVALITGGKDDAGVRSRIRSVTIVGQAYGTFGGGDHYGIVAEIVGALTIGGTIFTFTPGASNDVIAVGITGDFTVREV